MPPSQRESQPENPYSPGTLYALIFALLTGPRRLTREELASLAAAASGGSRETVEHSVWVVISPRETPENGEIRGNRSAKGYLYYVAEDAQGKLHAHSRVPPLEPLRADPSG